MVMQDLYETEYGIYNHLQKNKNRPIASVAFHQSEDINDGSLLEEIIRTYTVKNIKNLYGINLIDFLELPQDIVEMLFSIADEENNKKLNTLSEAEKQFEIK